MDVLVSIVGSLVAKAAEYTVDPIARRLSYLFKPRTKFLNLQSKVQDLKDARERLQRSVDSANRKGEVIFDDVQRWLTVANEKISEEAATQLQEDEEKATKRCFAGFCPDFKFSYQLSKKADREANAIAQLLTQKDTFDGVSYPSHPKGMDIIRPEKEYEAFESRSVAFNGVMAALEDDTISIIGVYGMGGVGKTTLVKEAANEAKEKQLFNEVVLVAINQTPNMMNIQKEIAEKLGLTIWEENIDVRAARLRERLKKEKRVLVILDDIWVTLDLEALGIPSGDEHKGCKILATSRRLDVLESLNSHPNISIETLNEGEAWNLFKKIGGPVVERSDLQSTTVEVAKRCAGLPIAIATIAKALKSKQNLFEWRDALRQLCNPSERNFKGIPADAYSAIELSYKFLEGEELGPIFLLCSIMGHNAAVNDLLRYAIGLGFIHDVNSMEQSRDRVLTLVNNLKASCLLLEGSSPNRFDMHDVVRDVAQSVASRDLHWLALFKEWPDDVKMKKSQLIRLQNAEVSELLNHELDCPDLTYFSIGMEEYSSLKYSNNFFKGMQRLKVLEFDKLYFTSLPSSIGSLKTLCTLRLSDCDLEDVVILGELENLEILDLSSSRIKMLPKEIGQLTRLKVLDLSSCVDLEVISPNVLSKLSKLEELYLYSSFNNWEVEGMDDRRSKASLVELQHLSHLTTLEVHIPDVEAIPNDNLFFRKMERYKISIGDEKWHLFEDWGVESSTKLKLQMKKCTHLVHVIKPLFGKSQSLCLDGLEDVGRMYYHPNAESFGQLRFIKLENSNTLKNLFTFSIAKRLCQLEKLEVFNCDNIRELIVEKEENDENCNLEFNKLRILKLSGLAIFNGSWYSENTLQHSTCLFDKKVSCPALEELVLDSVGGIEKVGYIDDQLPLISFGVQNLTRLGVYRCPKLKFVFTSSMVKSFVHLRTLEVSQCDEMEGVIEGILEAAEEERISGSIRVFPELDSLQLTWLPKLKRFCRGINPIEFPLLRSLEISKCPDLKAFPFAIGKSRVELSHYFFNEKVILPVLETLLIFNMDNLERLWTAQLAQHSFSGLTSIDLYDCPKLLNVFPLNMLTRLQRLNRLRVDDCVSLEEIIFESRPQGGGNSNAMASLSPQFTQSDVITFEFPNLTSLELCYLPNLRSIHRKMIALNWPSLKEVKVSGCDKVEVLFASRETSGNTTHQPLFWVDECTFPNLHQLTLGWNAGIKEIMWHCKQQQQHLSHYFHNLKVAKLECYPEQVTVLPSYLFLLLSLPNFQTLEITRFSFKEMVFQSGEGGEEKPALLLLSHITELSLEYLPQLTHLWKEKEGFPNLRILQLYWCPELKVNLVPSSVSFRNLVTLKVDGCEGIIKLITHSTAKSLVQLKEVYLSRCKNIEEIIQGGDDDDDEICFPQLNCMELYDLPKLESFCSSGNYTFAFPSFENLFLFNCPNMKMFSQGESNTPMLHKVGYCKWMINQYRDWEGSLNSTIQRQFR